MTRKIALSNLSLLPWSLIYGPKWTWELARAAGFDALKVNPLRGWDVATLTHLQIPVIAFEYLWRPNFWASVKNLWRRKDPMGFVGDTCFIGYAGAKHRCEGYAWSDYYSSRGTVAIDFPNNLRVRHLRDARETEYLPEKWPNPIDGNKLACFDTWHVRSYPDPDAITERLMADERIVLIDVQTRDYSEWLSFVRGQQPKLTFQLYKLLSTPETVGSSIEIAPQHLWRLSLHLRVSLIEALDILRERTQSALAPVC